MPKLGDRVKDTTTSTGTGNITLSGTPPTGFQSFNADVGVGVSFEYVIDDGAGSWEMGMGYLTDAVTLVRDTVNASSNAGSLVNFGAGTKTVFIDCSDEYLERMSYGRVIQKAYCNFCF